MTDEAWSSKSENRGEVAQYTVEDEKKNDDKFLLLLVLVLVLVLEK
jgi:hypothetical protein